VKSTSGIVYPMLMRTSYTEWSSVMRVNLQASGLWEAVQYGGGDYRDERHALATLLHAIPVDMQAGLVVKESAHEVSELIRRLRMGARVNVGGKCGAIVQRIHRDQIQAR
jgi:hypothetical protein